MSRMPTPDPLSQPLLGDYHLATPPALSVTGAPPLPQSPSVQDYDNLSEQRARCQRLQARYRALLEGLNDRFLKRHAAAADAANSGSQFFLKLREIDNIEDYAHLLNDQKLRGNPKALLKKLVKQITLDLSNVQKELKRLEEPFRAAELVFQTARAEELITADETDLEALKEFMRSRAGQRALAADPGLLERIQALPAVADVMARDRVSKHYEMREQQRRDYPQRLFEEQGVTLVDQWNQAKIFSMLAASVAVLGSYIAAFAIKRDDPEDTNTTILASVLAVVSLAGFMWGAKNQFSSASRNAEAILNWPDLVLGRQSGYINTKILPDSNNAKPVRQHSQPLSSSDVSMSASSFVRMQNNARMFGLLALAMAGLSAYIAITVKRDDPEDINATVLAGLLGLISFVGFSWGAKHQNKEAVENAAMVMDRPGGLAESLPAAGDDVEAGMSRAVSQRAYITQDNFSWIERAATRSRKVTTGLKSGVLGGVVMMSICAGSDWLTKGETRVGPVAQGIMVGAFLFTAILVPWSLQRWQRLPDPFGASVCQSPTPDADTAVTGERKEAHAELMYRGQPVSAAEQRGIELGLFVRIPGGDEAKAGLAMTAQGEAEVADLKARIAAAKAAEQAAEEHGAAGVPAAASPSSRM
ncbi:MAG: hypothetical protein P1U40_00525 [Coxiellaceae bacterium]|nr:hypothetical protein [Coxiellaceae bacterium]